jgi:hypothetical protein
MAALSLRRGWWLAWVLGGGSACTSYAQVSSGHIGCPAGEIEISNEYEGGWGMPSTWKATCHGVTYYCTMTTAAYNQGNASCKPALGGSPSEPPSAPDPVVTNRPEAPTKAAGFAFGASAEQAAQTCSEAGGRWQAGPTESTCSKPALPVGFDGKALVGFCQGRVCAVSVVQEAPDAQVEALKQAFVKITLALQGKYGKPDQAFVRAPSICSGRLASCLRTRQAKISADWHWPSEYAVRIAVVAPPEGVRLLLEYRAPGPKGAALEGL